MVRHQLRNQIRLGRQLGYATAGRNVGAALVSVGGSSVDPKAVVMLIVTGVVGLVLLLSAAAWARRTKENARTPRPPQGSSGEM